MGLALAGVRVARREPAALGIGGGSALCRLSTDMDCNAGARLVARFIRHGLLWRIGLGPEEGRFTVSGSSGSTELSSGSVNTGGFPPQGMDFTSAVVAMMVLDADYVHHNELGSTETQSITHQNYLRH